MLSDTFAKSSYSNPSGNCVEARWAKSSYSAPGGNCVETRTTDSSVTVQVRDSKDTTKPGLSIGAAAWSNFVGSLTA